MATWMMGTLLSLKLHFILLVTEPFVMFQLVYHFELESAMAWMLRRSTSEPYYEFEKGIREIVPISVETYESTVDTVKI
jgi:hypothetical protein